MPHPISLLLTKGKMTLEIPEARMDDRYAARERFPVAENLRFLLQKRIPLRIHRLVLLLTPSRYNTWLKRNTPLCVVFFSDTRVSKIQTGLGIKNAVCSVLPAWGLLCRKLLGGQ
jgi:hypothetical protein